MRIALFTNGFPEVPDGSYTPAVIDTLVELGRRHDLVIFSFGGGRPAGRSIYQFGPLQVVATGRVTRLNFIRELLWLARIVRKQHRRRPFAAVHGIWHVGGALAAGFGVYCSLPAVVSLMGGEVVRLNDPPYGVARRGWWRWLLRRVLRRAVQITVGSAYYYRKVAEFLPEIAPKVKVVPLGLDAERMPMAADSLHRPVRLLAVAAMQPVKKLDVLLQTLAAVGRKDWHLTIAGCGPLMPKIAAQVAGLGLRENVLLAGWLAAGRFKQSYRRFDALVNFSAHEAQGMALIEAAAAGLPLLTTEVGVVEELESLGAAIACVSAGPGAAPQLERFIVNLPALKRRASRAVRRVRGAFDLSKTIQEFEYLYAEVSRPPAPAAETHWYSVRPGPALRLRRRFRPLVFRLLLPVITNVRKRNAETTVAGLRLSTRMEVFHPKLFFSSRLLAQYLARQLMDRRRVLDMGTGSGIVGLLAARRGAQVVAVDINPLAVELARENAARHALDGAVTCLESDLFARLASPQEFDFIVFNPPFFDGKAGAPADHAFYAGEGFRTIERFFRQAPAFLAPGGRIVLIVSSDMPLHIIDDLRARAGLEIIEHRARPHFFEIFHFLQLGVAGAGPAHEWATGDCRPAPVAR